MGRGVGLVDFSADEQSGDAADEDTGSDGAVSARGTASVVMQHGAASFDDERADGGEYHATWSAAGRASVCATRSGVAESSNAGITRLVRTDETYVSCAMLAT